MNKLAFPKIARQLNYRRTLTSPVTARVDVPGFPYEAFDQSGAKVQPWSLLRFFESVRACTFWDYQKDIHPGESLADFHLILGEHLFFIVSARLTVHNYFYEENSPKFPLYVNAALDHVGRSSKRMSYHLWHPDVDTEYATCTVDDVLVSNKNRKPVAYPDWWMKKYGGLCTEKSSNLEIPRTNYSTTNCSNFQVNLTDIDTYNHTNWSAYVKFCFESVYKHVLDKKYKSITRNHIANGVKSINMLYKNESNLYDTLSIVTKEDNECENRVYGDIFKEDGTLCFQLMMDFFSSEHQSNL